MKKKIILLLLAVCMALAACFAAACNDGRTYDGGEKTRGRNAENVEEEPQETPELPDGDGNDPDCGPHCRMPHPRAPKDGDGANEEIPKPPKHKFGRGIPAPKPQKPPVQPDNQS